LYGLEGGNHLGKLNAVKLILHEKVCHFYSQVFILGAWILLEYYDSTMLFQGNYYRYFQRRQGMHVCGVACEQLLNASQLQEQNTKTCLG